MAPKQLLSPPVSHVQIDSSLKISGLKILGVADLKVVGES